MNNRSIDMEADNVDMRCRSNLKEHWTFRQVLVNFLYQVSWKYSSLEPFHVFEHRILDHFSK
jgi:hypothetical protein